MCDATLPYNDCRRTEAKAARSWRERESGREGGRERQNRTAGRAADTLFDLQHFGGEIKDVDVIGIAVVKVP